MATSLNIAELQRWLNEGRDFALIDVLPEEAFTERHLPGARKACVYEVDFLDQITNLGVRKDQPIVVYGTGPDALESATAAEKLDRAGYAKVFDFRGGQAEWKAAGGTFEGRSGKSFAARSPRDRECVVDVSKSTVEWIGRNLMSTHRGTVRIAEGRISVRGGALASGRIILDLQSIENADLDDPGMRQLLEHHLKSDDFFDVERFPTAELVLTSAEPFEDSIAGSPNFRFAAELTLKGVTRSIEFPAIVAEGEDGTVRADAQLEIDRTRWNVLYGSGRFYRMLGKHLVADIITLLVKIVAK
jgi:rhodanese-related sulfurtransferase/polyisoprenoid-binding protein YceI